MGLLTRPVHGEAASAPREQGFVWEPPAGQATGGRAQLYAGMETAAVQKQGGETLSPWMDGPYPAPRGGKADRQPSFCSGGADAGGAEP